MNKLTLTSQQQGSLREGPGTMNYCIVIQNQLFLPPLIHEFLKKKESQNMEKNTKILISVKIEFR